MHIILRMITDKLRNLRIKNGLTQSTLAQLSGVSLPTIQNIEAGKANPSILVLEKILTTLGAQLKIEIKPLDYDLLTLFNMNLSEFKQIDLKSTLLNIENKCDFKKISGRELDLFAALYSALFDHYPQWLRQNKLSLSLNSRVRLLIKKTEPNRLIKFRRIWLAKLSQVI